MTSAHDLRQAQGGGYPPGGYGPPGGGGPGGYGPPGGGGPGGYGPPGGGGPGGYGPPGGGGPGDPGGYGPPGGPPGGPGGYGPPGGPAGYGPPGYPPPGGYGPPAPPYGAPFPSAGGGPPYGAPAGSPNAELKKRAQNWLIASALSVVFCTSCFGIIGAVLCYMAMQAADQGNLADGENKLKWGKIITIVGLVIGVLLSIGLVAFYVVQIVAATSH